MACEQDRGVLECGTQRPLLSLGSRACALMSHWGPHPRVPISYPAGSCPPALCVRATILAPAQGHRDWPVKTKVLPWASRGAEGSGGAGPRLPSPPLGGKTGAQGSLLAVGRGRRLCSVSGQSSRTSCSAFPQRRPLLNV